MDDDGLDRRVVAGTAAACVLITLIFIATGFPYDRLGERIIAALEQSTGAHIEYAQFQHVFTWAGPGLEWQDVRYREEDGTQLDFDRARLRAGWSPSWFVGDPAVHVDLSGPAGRIVGLAIGGDEPGFDGAVEQVALDQLPYTWLDDGYQLSGTVDGDLDLRIRSAGPEGTVLLEGRDGLLSGDALGVGLPFDQLTAHVSLDGDKNATIEALHVEGPLLRADVTGTIGTGSMLAEAPLDLAVEIDADGEVVKYLQRAGIYLDGPGATSLSVVGTAGAPEVR